MLYQSIATLFLLPIALRSAWAHETRSSSTACNNSPKLCDIPYNQITHLGAHDSPFLRDASTSYTAIGDQFYNTSVQLSAGVRLVTAQVQPKGGALHVCHTQCDFLDAGPLSDWLGEVRSWLESNPNDVVTVLLVNGANASPSNLAAQYQKAGITTSLAYTPTGSSAQSQEWPTLQSLISNGTRMINFVDYIQDASSVPWIMSEFEYIFETPYDVTSLAGFSCDANRPPSAIGKTTEVISTGMMPFMNHFLYDSSAIGVDTPNEAEVNVTNAPSGGIGTLGDTASQCTEEYGRPPTYILVDYFNVGPAISTVDRLNNVTDPVGRLSVSTKVLTSAASFETQISWTLFACLTTLLAVAML